MKKKLAKKMITSLLVLSLSVLPMFNVNAEEISDVNDLPETADAVEIATEDAIRTNIKYEKGNIESLFETNTRSRTSFNDLIYTYEENGEQFKVYETVNNDLTLTDSTIYKLAANNEEVLVRTERVEVSGYIITTTINENGQESVDVVNLKSDIKVVPEEESLNPSIQSRATLNGLPVSNQYKLWLTTKYSRSITSTTTAGVTAIISAIAKVANIHPYVKITVTAVSGIVNYLVRVNAKRVYIKESIYFKWTNVPNVTLQQKAVEYTARTYYTDSNYATVTGSTSTYTYAKGYKN